jgi:hypothetical protein
MVRLMKRDEQLVHLPPRSFSGQLLYASILSGLGFGAISGIVGGPVWPSIVGGAVLMLPLNLFLVSRLRAAGQTHGWPFDSSGAIGDWKLMLSLGILVLGFAVGFLLTETQRLVEAVLLAPLGLFVAYRVRRYLGL